ncbi:MAG TPA: glycosyltransferase family A protein [Solirubrobacteraceae bacterium]|nr:glycosyltransferase family A protein [Solirubrobacteraceae bacterium]
MTGLPSDPHAAPTLRDPRGNERPQVTIAIVTHNRKDDLRAAVRSALEQQGASLEVLVIDDGSTDGTLDMLRDEFPEVRTARFDDGAGVPARKNDATRLARGEIIVSIDDDSVLSSPRVVADTVKDFDHPRIGVVAMPVIDVRISPEEYQRAPEPQHRWVGSVYRNNACALRRDVVIEVGGYTPEIGWVGEEWDLSMKLLDAGYVIRLGRSDPVHHHTSPKRDFRRQDIYGRRNEFFISWTYFPFPWNFVAMCGYAIKGLSAGIRAGRARNMLVGIRLGVRLCVANRDRRRPISRRAFRFDQQARAALRSGGALRLDEVEHELPPLGLPARRPGPWSRLIRWLHLSLRQVRTNITETFGRPVYCEACGQELFKGMPFIWRGRLKLLGAESAEVRVDFDKMNRMTFRHLHVDRCRPE